MDNGSVLIGKELSHLIDTVKRVRVLLKEQDVSMYSFCLANDLNYSTINTTERRSGQLSLDTIDRICAGLGITLSEFFDWSEDEDGETTSTESLRQGRSGNG